jgi:uncharacterized protein YkwD
VRYESFAQPEIARLEELRWSAVEERMSLELELGRHGAVLGELERLVPAAPLRERLVELRMRALYRAGRHVDALALYRDFSRRLNSDLGLEPGPSLRELERAILTHDPSVAPPGGRPALRAPPTATGSQKRRLLTRALLVCAAAFVIGWAAIGIAGATRADEDGLSTALNALRRERAEAAPVRIAILEYVNGERLVSRSEALESSARLEEVAQTAARRDAIHGKAEVGTIAGAILDFGWNRVGESVAAGTGWPDVPPRLVDKRHEREVMTSNDFTQIGIGVAFDGDARMWIHAIVAG